MIKILDDVCVDPNLVEYMTVEKVLVSSQLTFSTQYQVQINMKDNKVFESKCYDTKEKAKEKMNKLLKQINKSLSESVLKDKKGEI